MLNMNNIHKKLPQDDSVSANWVIIYYRSHPLQEPEKFIDWKDHASCCPSSGNGLDVPSGAAFYIIHLALSKHWKKWSSSIVALEWKNKLQVLWRYPWAFFRWLETFKKWCPKCIRKGAWKSWTAVASLTSRKSAPHPSVQISPLSFKFLKVVHQDGKNHWYSLLPWMPCRCSGLASKKTLVGDYLLSWTLELTADAPKRSIPSVEDRAVSTCHRINTLAVCILLGYFHDEDSADGNSIPILIRSFWTQTWCASTFKKLTTVRVFSPKDEVYIHLWTNPWFNMGVSKKVGFPPKSSISIGFSIINHPFLETPISKEAARDVGKVKWLYD